MVRSSFQGWNSEWTIGEGSDGAFAVPHGDGFHQRVLIVVIVPHSVPVLAVVVDEHQSGGRLFQPVQVLDDGAVLVRVAVHGRRRAVGSHFTLFCDGASVRFLRADEGIQIPQADRVDLLLHRRFHGPGRIGPGQHADPTLLSPHCAGASCRRSRSSTCVQARARVLMLFMHTARLPISRARFRAGMITAIRMAMMAITTNSSMSVNA